MYHVLTVVGTRPNFIKVGALHRAFLAQPTLEPRLVHTGQHYDREMSGVFFEQLGLPRPHKYLDVGSGSHAEQTARIMIALERTVLEDRPDAAVVVGDVNSTLAAALVCAKLHIPVAHVEAGLRSGDRTMPEEINRLATDAVANIFYVTEQSGVDNLRNEGVPEERICFAGNVMIDSLIRYRQKAAATGTVSQFGLERGRYVLMTMHRPASVDVPHRLERLVQAIERIAAVAPLVFPIHPRTRTRLDDKGLTSRLQALGSLRLVEPLGYLEFLDLMASAGVLVTDSGGIQEETTFLGVPCVTLRSSTERPITTELGTNRLVPLNPDAVESAVREALAGRWPKGQIPPLWDGHAAERIATHLAHFLRGC